ncbi:MAG: hypothetical protein AABY15_09855 [Nanoarchaeota archaeon]
MPSGVYIRTKPSHWKGKKKLPFSKEWRENMRKGQLGRKLSKETKLKISQSKQERKIKLGYINSPEARRKNSETQKVRFSIKENHPRWKGGLRIRRNERNDSLYQLWVERVKKRDSWKCKMENQDCFGYCVVHHILSWREYPELRYEVNNGITLCQFHHPRKRVDEQKMIPILQSIIYS